jgi:hypothetical protein
MAVRGLARSRRVIRLFCSVRCPHNPFILKDCPALASKATVGDIWWCPTQLMSRIEPLGGHQRAPPGVARAHPPKYRLQVRHRQESGSPGGLGTSTVGMRRGYRFQGI